jgi:subtilisin family serine protease
MYPASYTSANILSVAAINNQGNLADFSNYGAKSVDVSAPGVDVLSSIPAVSEEPASWTFFNGTSMATPHATGVAALAASDSPDLLSNPTTLKQVLMDSGKPVSATTGKTVTGKMVDASAVLGPAVTAISPRDGATGTSRYTNATATFSEAMDEASLEATDPTTGKSTSFTLVRSGTTTPVSATVTYDATTKRATLNPSGRLRSRTTYIATITTTAKNSAGEPIAYSKSWKFRTKR